ncbi:MAG: AmmeMemoRadiSam system radical SAM enzyme, partial [Mariprofundaceae bacterium]
GNVHDTGGGTTCCPACKAKLIVRDWYEILDYSVTDSGNCLHCGQHIAGHFKPFTGAFGNRRIPVSMHPVSGDV